MNSTRVGVVREPDAGRGTIGILWGCATTIFLCIYTSLHPHVPGRRTSLGRPQREHTTTELILRKVKYMVISLILPESMISAVEFLSFP